MKRPLWKPKEGPILTLGRFAHFLIAYACAVTGAMVDGYNGLGISAMVFVVAYVWETVSRWLFAKKFPFGDIVDLLAFIIGWVAGFVVFCLR